MLRGDRAPGERWREQDSLLAQALTQYEATLCDGCGHPLAESMDPDSEGRYVAPPPMRCHACTAVQARAEDYAEQDAPQALRFHAELRPPRVTRG